MDFGGAFLGYRLSAHDLLPLFPSISPKGTKTNPRYSNYVEINSPCHHIFTKNNNQTNHKLCSCFIHIVYLAHGRFYPCLVLRRELGVGRRVLLGGIRTSRCGATLFGMAYMLYSGHCGRLCYNGVNHQEGIVGLLRVSMHINRWWTVALLTPEVLVALSLGLSSARSGGAFDGSGEGLVQR